MGSTRDIAVTIRPAFGLPKVGFNVGMQETAANYMEISTISGENRIRIACQQRAEWSRCGAVAVPGISARSPRS